MGNCQAIDAATLVIQHPCGKTERFYSPMSAKQVIKINPGHCVALLISSTTMCTTKKDIENKSDTNTNTNRVRLTRIKLLKPTDTLLLGHVYRLITTQEVMKGLKEKRQAKMRQKNMSDSTRKFASQDNQAIKLERPRPRTTTSASNIVSVTAKTRFWQPSLQSISEVAS